MSTEQVTESTETTTIEYDAAGRQTKIVVNTRTTFSNEDADQ